MNKFKLLTGFIAVLFAFQGMPIIKVSGTSTDSNGSKEVQVVANGEFKHPGLARVGVKYTEKGIKISFTPNNHLEKAWVGLRKDVVYFFHAYALKLQNEGGHGFSVENLEDFFRSESIVFISPSSQGASAQVKNFFTKLLLEYGGSTYSLITKEELDLLMNEVVGLIDHPESKVVGANIPKIESVNALEVSMHNNHGNNSSLSVRTSEIGPSASSKVKSSMRTTVSK